MMKAREARAGASADLLLCFPSRPHLTLVPKPICSPGRAFQSTKRRKSSTRAAAHASPPLWAKAKSATSDDAAEPSSPKVTCAGQIKVRQSTGNWQSMMHEIEKIHDDGKLRKRSNWPESLRFKKEIMQFLTCIRTLRFDLRCFGSFPAADNTTEDDDGDYDEEEEGYLENHVGTEETGDDSSRAVFSKWFMTLQESQNDVFDGEDVRNEDNVSDDGSIAESGVPPPNALLLMRCRSAPAKSWFEENEGQGKEGDAPAEESKEVERTNMHSVQLSMEKEETETQNMVVMRYGSDFHKMSPDIAKESWIAGHLRDALPKSRSWRI